MKPKKQLNLILLYWNKFWIAILIIYIGVATTNAFTSKGDFATDWLIIIGICLPFYLVGSYAQSCNKEELRK